MSDSTDVNREQSGTPHRSRREQRKAERAAEREAYLTGQQPLLTRREMRRLREEADALREAIAAGELTEEEARALQDPTYEGENLSVMAGVVSGEEPVVNAEHEEDGYADEGYEADRYTDGGREADRYETEEWSGLDEPSSYDVGRRSWEPEPEPVERYRSVPTERYRSEAAEPGYLTEAEDLGADPLGLELPEPMRADLPELELPEPVPADLPELELPEVDLPEVPEPVHAELPEPELPEVDLPEVPEPVRPTPVASMVPDAVVPVAPAPYDTASSYEQQPRAEQDSWSDDDSWDEDEESWEDEDAWEDEEVPAPQGAEGYSSDEVSAIAAVETGVLDAVDLDAMDDELSGASEADDSLPGVPERRSLFETSSPHGDVDASPEVASPDLGSRHEDAHSSDSLVSPYGIASPDGFASPDSAAWDEATEAPAPPPTPMSPSSPARRPIVRIPSTVQGVRTVDRDTGELSSVQPVDDEFSGIDNPQWKALRDAEGSEVADVADVDAPEYVSAPTPEEPETSTRLSAPVDDEDIEELKAIVAEERKGRGVRRTLLIALVVLVILLVAATVVWFVLVRGGNVFAVSSFVQSLQPLIH